MFGSTSHILLVLGCSLFAFFVGVSLIFIFQKDDPFTKQFSKLMSILKKEDAQAKMEKQVFQKLREDEQLDALKQKVAELEVENQRLREDSKKAS
ncbi:MAG: hypothetical protein HOE90_22900 [Bacteriovoracaceae bacterium]|jgi:hypothetical protein|nr:hypothetical protein [Bacteriovoracaceae bacterium]